VLRKVELHVADRVQGRSKAAPDEARALNVVGHDGGPTLGDVSCLADQGLCVIVLTNQKVLAPGLAGELLQMLAAAPSK
jgi:hypothetical protein